ncbi:hypothetical protein D9M71_756040 [compost metagenome]
MRIIEACQHLRRVHAIGLIEAYAEGYRGVEALQNVHVVGHGRRGIGRSAEAIVPTGPGLASVGQQAGVGVQQNFVGGIDEGAQHLVLSGCRLLK